MKQFIYIIFSLIGAFLGFFIGEFDGFLYALLIFVIIDYISGVSLAVCNRKLSSEIGFRGIIKKIFIFILVGIGNVLDIYIVKSGAILRTIIIFFYLSNEGISIIENSSNIGLPVPAKLKQVLKTLNKED